MREFTHPMEDPRPINKKISISNFVAFGKQAADMSWAGKVEFPHSLPLKKLPDQTTATPLFTANAWA
jgi:hypothetical protein